MHLSEDWKLQSHYYSQTELLLPFSKLSQSPKILATKVYGAAAPRAAMRPWMHYSSDKIILKIYYKCISLLVKISNSFIEYFVCFLFYASFATSYNHNKVLCTQPIYIIQYKFLCKDAFRDIASTLPRGLWRWRSKIFTRTISSAWRCERRTGATATICRRFAAD